MESKIATALKQTRFPWWVVLVEGGIALIFGLLLITAPHATTLFLVTVLGFYFLIRGIISIIEIFLPKRGTHWGWHLCMGILGIIAGIVVLRHLVIATDVLELFIVTWIASVGLIMGIVGLIRAFLGGGWGPGILGVLSIIIAIFLFAHLLGAVLDLPTILGACMIVGGIVAIVYAFRIRRT